MQVQHYTGYINRNKAWKLAGIYAEMKIAKMIQFESTDPLKKCRIKGFWHICCCQGSLFSGA